MVDSNPVDPGDSVVARLRGLPDAELLAVIEAVTADRPALAPLHAAAIALASGGPGPDFPPDPTRPVTPPEVLPPLTMAGGSPVDDQADYTDAGVPTFDRVRDRIGDRIGTALGSEEIERGSRAGRDVDEQWQARERAGRERLDEIRRSMRRD